MAPKLKNFRLDDDRVALLAFFAERFGMTETEVFRRCLDDLNDRYGEALRVGELFIEELRERYGADARLELRLSADGTSFVSAPAHYAPKFVPHRAEVRVNGELDESLYGKVISGTIEDRIRGRDHVRVFLMPAAQEGDSLTDVVPKLYIGELDPGSPASLVIALQDLRKEMQVFAFGRPSYGTEAGNEE